MKLKPSHWLSYVAKYTMKSKRILLAISMLIVASSLLALSVPYALHVIFDNLGTTLRDARAFALAACCLLLMMLKFFVDYSYKSLAASRTSKMFANMVSDLYTHMLSLGMDFYIGTKSGEFTQSFDQDMYIIVRMIMNDFMALFASITQVVLMVAFLGYINPVLMCISLAFVPVYYALKKRTDTNAKNANGSMIKAWNNVSCDIHENLSGIKAIKEANAEDYCIKKNINSLGEVARAFNDLERQNAKTAVVTSFFGQVIPFIVLILGIVSYKAIGLSLGALFAAFYIVTGIFSPLGAIVIQGNSIQKGKASVERVMRYLDMRSNVPEADDACSIKQARGAISFANVSFGYTDKNVISDVSFSVQGGESMAIVGPSGAGKSSLVSLVYRLYDPREGRVLFDGVDAKNYRISDLRKQIGYIGQETVLFHASVRENLRIADTSASMDDMMHACRIAGIHDAIMQKEDRYETVIGEKGMKLSGGQRQRIALARMILKKPAVVIFDESFSNIDSESEYAFFENVEEMFSGKTKLIISHRLSSIVNSDKVMYMEDGRIVGIRKHNDLLKENKNYRELWKEQCSVN